jgi:hypothetical protein
MHGGVVDGEWLRVHQCAHVDGTTKWRVVAGDVGFINGRDDDKGKGFRLEWRRRTRNNVDWVGRGFK